MVSFGNVYIPEPVEYIQCRLIPLVTSIQQQTYLLCAFVLLVVTANNSYHKYGVNYISECIFKSRSELESFLELLH